MKNINALIIEDDEMSAELMANFLEGMDIQYQIVNDPRNVENVLAQTSAFDVVFLDLEMPHVTGYDILPLLKARLNPQVPIVACTVHHNEMAHAKQVGFYSFLAKPLNFDRFPQQLESILNHLPIWETK